MRFYLMSSKESQVRFHAEYTEIALTTLIAHLREGGGDRKERGVGRGRQKKKALIWISALISKALHAQIESILNN